MEQRTMILRAWARGGEGRQGIARAAAPAQRAAAARSQEASQGTKAARDFAALMRDNPEACWEDMVKEFRDNYYDALEELIPPLLALNDPLITLNLVRFADPNSPREIALLRQIIDQSDPELHQHSLRALAALGHPELTPAIQRKRDLPESVREVLSPPATPPTRTPRRARKSG